MKKNLFNLLLVAIGKKNELPVALSIEEWEDLFAVLEKQCILGIGFDAISKLPEPQRPPKHLLLRAFTISEYIKSQNQILNNHILELKGIMNNMNIPYCILKGQGSALLYPKPEYRQSGDIDVWCDCERTLLLERVGKKYIIGEKVIHHADVEFFKNISVDLHYIPTWLYAPWHNTILQKFFLEEKDAQMTNINKCGYCSPTIKFNLVYSMLHLFRHLFEEGIGLRQFLDYYYIILHSTTAERKEATLIIKKIGKISFLGAVMFVLKEVFLLEDHLLLVKPNHKLGRILLDEIWIGGNFGYYDNRVKKDRSLLDRTIRRLKRQSNLYSFSLSEVVCSPFWKIWHYYWRKKNGYL